MLTIGFYVLAAFGLAYIVGHSRISLPFRLLLARPAGPSRAVFFCPKCAAKHIDLGEWATRPHHTHLCQKCGHTFDVVIEFTRWGGPNPPPGMSFVYHHVAEGTGERVFGVESTVEASVGPRSVLRDFFLELLECPACFGTWTGGVVGFFVPELVGLVVTADIHRVYAALTLAAFTAATNFLIGRASGLVSNPGANS